MGNWASRRKPEATEDEELKAEEMTKGAQGSGLRKFFRKSQWAPCPNQSLLRSSEREQQWAEDEEFWAEQMDLPSSPKPKETSLSASEILDCDLDLVPKEVLSTWGRRGAMLRRAAQRSCPPLPSLTLWVSGDGGEREENYRYHRLMGNLVSSTVAEDDLPSPTWSLVPPDQAMGPPPPPPLQHLANSTIMAQGHALPYLNLNHGE